MAFFHKGHCKGGFEEEAFFRYNLHRLSTFQGKVANLCKFLLKFFLEILVIVSAAERMADSSRRPDRTEKGRRAATQTGLPTPRGRAKRRGERAYGRAGRWRAAKGPEKNVHQPLRVPAFWYGTVDRATPVGAA